MDFREVDQLSVGPSGVSCQACSRTRLAISPAPGGHLTPCFLVRQRRLFKRDKTLKLYERHFHDLLADIGKQQVMADIQAWIDAHLGTNIPRAGRELRV
jgi:hypothetical protein